MAEGFQDDSLPDLKELESKVGRKTPESLLMWMKDATADRDETWRGDVDDNNHSNDEISAKITNLKQEMRWLRSTDVRILRQLIAVHEGIEAMRWLVEERAASGSQSSSLTGSLSSLITVDEPGISISRYRDSLTSPQDLTEDNEEDLDLQHHAVEVPKTYLSPEYPSQTHSPIFSACKFDVRSTSTSSPPQPQHYDEDDPDPVRSALLRSCRVSRREKPKVNLSKEDTIGETNSEKELEKFEDKMTSGNKNEQEVGKMLLVYDTQWCWVESQDDVTFL